MAVRKQGSLPNLPRKGKALVKTLPLQIANLALNHFLEGFRKGGGQTDRSASGWRQRKRPDRGQARRGRRAILVKSGDLRRDVQVRRTTFREIVIGTLDTAAYATVHNDGLPSRNIPQREYLGDSRKLDQKIVKLSTSEMKKAFDR